MTDAPERIWAVQGLSGFISFNDYDNGEQEYVRADLYAEGLARAEKAEAEVERLRSIVSDVEWYNANRAALAEDSQ